MRKIYHLSTCDTCRRILKELQPLDGGQIFVGNSKKTVAAAREAIHN
jgi:arsenate reductase-like glutaredoxin family protein